MSLNTEDPLNAIALLKIYHKKADQKIAQEELVSLLLNGGKVANFVQSGECPWCDQWIKYELPLNYSERADRSELFDKYIQNLENCMLCGSHIVWIDEVPLRQSQADFITSIIREKLVYCSRCKCLIPQHSLIDETNKCTDCLDKRKKKKEKSDRNNFLTCGVCLFLFLLPALIAIIGIIISFVKNLF